jgi:hypothetical protein
MPSATQQRRPVRVRLAAVALIAAMSAGSLVMWAGVPALWLFIASKVTTQQRAGFGPYLLIIIGIPASMAIVGKLLSRLNRVYGRVTGTTPTVRVRMPWHRSLRGEQEGRHQRTMLDVVMLATVLTAAVVFGIWFFFLAGSSLPGSS